MKMQMRKRGRGFEVYYTPSTKDTPSRAALAAYVEEEALHIADIAGRLADRTGKRSAGRAMALVINKAGNGLHLALCDSDEHEVVGECMIYPCGCYTSALNRLHGLLLYNGALSQLKSFMVVKNY